MKKKMPEFNKWLAFREQCEPMPSEFSEDILSALGRAGHRVLKSLEGGAEQERVRAHDMFKMAQELDGLEVFLPNKLPEDAYLNWSTMTNYGKRLRSGMKPGESPKVTFNRFIQQKRENFEKLKREFRNKYGFDFKDIDIRNSHSDYVLNNKGEILAPIMH